MILFDRKEEVLTVAGWSSLRELGEWLIYLISSKNFGKRTFFNLLKKRVIRNGQIADIILQEWRQIFKAHSQDFLLVEFEENKSRC